MSDTPRKAHSKSEYKRLTAMGAEVLPPTPPTVTEHAQPHASRVRSAAEWMTERFPTLSSSALYAQELRDAAAYIERLEQERDAARLGLFHRITGWDVDGQQETKAQDELQVLRDEVPKLRAEAAALREERDRLRAQLATGLR